VHFFIYPLHIKHRSTAKLPQYGKKVFLSCFRPGLCLVYKKFTTFYAGGKYALLELAWMLFRMFFYGLNAGMETPVSLNGIVNNALLNTSPNINQIASSNRPHPVHFCLDSLMHQIWQSTGLWSGLLGDINLARWMLEYAWRWRRLIVSHALRAGALSYWTIKNSQRPDVWQAANVVTAARHDNGLHWPWLRDRRILNWCNLILTCRLSRLSPSVTDWIRAIFEF